jgi:hypothetical protein
MRFFANWKTALNSRYCLAASLGHAAGRASIQANVSTIYSEYIDALLKLATLIERLEARMVQWRTIP